MTSSVTRPESREAGIQDPGPTVRREGIEPSTY